MSDHGTARHLAPAAATATEEGEAYAHGEDRPLGSFLVLMGAYGVVVALLSGLVRASGRRLPERLAWDLACSP